MLFICVGALASSIEIISILYQFSPKVLKTVLGYAVWVEIFFSVGLTAMFMTTGTVSGMIIATLTGLFAAAIMQSTKYIIGYRRYTKDPVTGKRRWIEYEGTVNAFSFGILIKEMAKKVGVLGSKMISGVMTTNTKTA